MKREYKIVVSILLFAAVTGFFYLLKVQMNERNAGNQHLLSTAVLNDEIKEDIFRTDFFERSTYTEPMTKEDFVDEAKSVAKTTRSPQMLQLTNLTAFETKDQNTQAELESVSIAIIKQRMYLLLKEQYLLLVLQPDTVSDVFQIDGTGQVGLASKTIRYDMTVLNDQRPEEFLSSLPAFVEKVQLENGLETYESRVFVTSKWGRYLYNSTKQNQLIKVEEIS
ncbi:hypothetical protein [Enterococcus casseliflavus]|uniref:hypothetical protein n=1 Tax=Enterococcus casseliflavus TaxID=37734 RepID=UPI001785284D|nr:hypothetical protein [Enterococcus casseliflavus]MBO6385798.1 hypothetical protein [Enterococcus casseliflavus]